MRFSHLAWCTLALGLAGPALAQDAVPSQCPSGTIGYWTFDAAADPGKDDYAGRPGTVRGATWSESGQVGGALYFDSNDDVYVGDVRPISSSSSGGVTFAFWGKPDQVPGEATRVLVYKSYAWNDQPGDLWCRVSHYEGQLYVESVINAAPYVWEPHYVWSVPVTGDPSAYHHVACTYDSDKLRVYFDGELAGTADVTNGRTDATNDNPLTFGSQYPRGPTPGIDNSRGYLDEVAVFGRALGLDEIAQMYESGLDGRGYCTAPVLLSVHFYHPEVSGCIKMQGTVRLAEPAPAGGLIVTLHSDNENAVVPASVVVKEGALMKRFQILTSPVAVREDATITASVPGQEVSAILGVKPMVLKDLVLSPNPVVGGNPAVGTMTLQCPAAPGDIEVTLASKNPSVANPTVSHITIPFGTQVMTFDLTTTPVTRAYTPAISATANGVKRSRPLTVNPVP